MDTWWLCRTRPQEGASAFCGCFHDSLREPDHEPELGEFYWSVGITTSHESIILRGPPMFSIYFLLLEHQPSKGDRLIINGIGVGHRETISQVYFPSSAV